MQYLAFLFLVCFVGVGDDRQVGNLSLARRVFAHSLCGWLARLGPFILLLFLLQLLQGVCSSTPAHPFLVPETTQSPVLPADDRPLGQNLEDPTGVCAFLSHLFVISPFS